MVYDSKVKHITSSVLRSGDSKQSCIKQYKVTVEQEVIESLVVKRIMIMNDLQSDYCFIMSLRLNKVEVVLLGEEIGHF